MLFHPSPLPRASPLSPPARSKVIFDGMDNSSQPDRWDTVRDAHHSSSHQPVKDVSWSITWRGGENWPLDKLEGKQWYENSTSFGTYLPYHAAKCCDDSNHIKIISNNMRLLDLDVSTNLQTLCVMKHYFTSAPLPRMLFIQSEFPLSVPHYWWHPIEMQLSKWYMNDSAIPSLWADWIHCKNDSNKINARHSHFFRGFHFYKYAWP